MIPFGTLCNVAAVILGSIIGLLFKQIINEDLNKCYKQIIGYLDGTIEYNKSDIEKHIKKLV